MDELSNQDIDLVLEDITRIISHPLEYEVTITGLGDLTEGIGTNIFTELLDVEEIQKINLVNRTNKKSELLVERASIQTEKNLDFHNINSLEKTLKKTDISIISANNYYDPYGSRLEQLEDNLDLIKDIAQKHKEAEFYGTVILVTNPTDILAQTFAIESKLDASRIIGMNHLDMLRYNKVIRDMINKEYKLDIEVVSPIVGLHLPDEITPLISNTTTKEGIPIDAFLEEILIQENRDLEEIKIKIQEDISNLAIELKKNFGNSSKETAYATAGIVKSIINQEDIVGISVYDSKERVFLGWPSRFVGFSAYPLSKNEFKEPFTDSENLGINNSYKKMKSILKSNKIKGKINYNQVNSKIERHVGKRLRECIEDFVGDREDLIKDLRRELKNKDSIEIPDISRLIDTIEKELREVNPKFSNEFEGRHNLMLESLEGEVWYGHKQRRYSYGKDEWVSSKEFKSEPEVYVKDGGFIDARAGEIYKIVRLTDKENTSLIQGYLKLNNDEFKGIFHTNNEEYVNSECRGDCIGKCSGLRGHVESWNIGFSPEIKLGKKDPQYS